MDFKLCTYNWTPFLFKKFLFLFKILHLDVQSKLICKVLLKVLKIIPGKFSFYLENLPTSDCTVHILVPNFKIQYTWNQMYSENNLEFLFKTTADQDANKNIKHLCTRRGSSICCHILYTVAHTLIMVEFTMQV